MKKYYAISIACAVLVCFSIFFFFNGQKQWNRAAVLQGENNILKKERDIARDSVKQAIIYSDSLSKSFVMWQDSVKNENKKFNEKLHIKVRAVLQADDTTAMRQLSGFLEHERREIGE